MIAIRMITSTHCPCRLQSHRPATTSEISDSTNRFSRCDVEPRSSLSCSSTATVRHVTTGIKKSYSKYTCKFSRFSENYYGASCTEYCVPQDSNSAGHYTCDQNTGRKVCMAGSIRTVHVQYIIHTRISTCIFPRGVP